MSVYKVFILLVFNRERMERNVTPSFGMLFSKLSNRNTHVCASSIRMIRFFYPQCELFTSCSVSNNVSLVFVRTRGGVVVNHCGQTWRGGGGVPKIPKFLWTSFMDDPIVIRNGKIVQKVAWFEYYLRLNLNSRRYQYQGYLRMHQMYKLKVPENENSCIIYVTNFLEP